ncbi:MAG TPA: hypothetical protein VHW23_18690 [Kofleriaceae bacterium]|jgi:hypothetical protein|nr:hypothetical protein [Kofleriaceae bacterium]
MQLLEQAFGAILILIALIDVFLTVLYARMGTGFVAAPSRGRRGRHFARSRGTSIANAAAA